MNARVVFVFCLASLWLCGIAASQTRAERLFKLLQGEPLAEPSHAEIAGFNEYSSLEKQVLHQIRDTMGSLTEQSLQKLAGTDVVLRMIYIVRAGSQGSGLDGRKWEELVDQDINRRPDSKSVFLSIFDANRGNGIRGTIMIYLARDNRVSWGGEFMETCIENYQANWKEWRGGDTRALCELLRAFGGEQHLDFLAFVQRTYGHDMGVGDFIRLRLQAEKNGVPLPQPPQSRSSVSILSSKQPGASKSMQVPDVSQQSGESIDWLVITILALAFILLACLLFLLRCRRR
jgi:hypothetical protein